MSNKKDVWKTYAHWFQTFPPSLFIIRNRYYIYMRLRNILCPFWEEGGATYLRSYITPFRGGEVALHGSLFLVYSFLHLWVLSGVPCLREIYRQSGTPNPTNYVLEGRERLAQFAPPCSYIICTPV